MNEWIPNDTPDCTKKKKKRKQKVLLNFIDILKKK